VAASTTEAVTAIQDGASSATPGAEPPGPAATEVAFRALDDDAFRVFFMVMAIEG
jgi:hypothetical protein